MVKGRSTKGIMFFHAANSVKCFKGALDCVSSENVFSLPMQEKEKWTSDLWKASLFINPLGVLGGKRVEGDPIICSVCSQVESSQMPTYKKKHREEDNKSYCSSRA
jgi:hypothetical protein